MCHVQEHHGLQACHQMVTWTIANFNFQHQSHQVSCPTDTTSNKHNMQASVQVSSHVCGCLHHAIMQEMYFMTFAMASRSSLGVPWHVRDHLGLLLWGHCNSMLASMIISSIISPFVIDDNNSCSPCKYAPLLSSSLPLWHQW